MIDTRRDVRGGKARTGGSWFAWALLAVAAAVVVAINNRPAASPEEVLRGAFDQEKVKQERAAEEAKRQQEQAAETQRAQDAVVQCIDYVHKAYPYDQSFDAYYDPTTRYHWTGGPVGSWFQWKKCMSALGHSMD